jgi:2-polyprenyl-3-methyl-5-hydroxy-6-metoxy-1,4-benzoquinol methylase
MDTFISKKFGYEWDLYREIIPLHKDQFEGWISPLPIEFFKGKRFLDAGCGIGRNSVWPLEAGAASCYAFDFDERTVNVAKTNLARFPNCEVGLGSIYDLKFKNEFDVAFCIGVIHHLERPREALTKLIETVKPGGHLIVWVYAREGNRLFLSWFDPLRKFLTSHLSFRLNVWIARFFTVLLRAYLLLPLRSPYLGHLRKRTFRHVEAMVCDQLIPPIAHYWTQDQILDLVKNLGAEVVHLTHTNKISWTLVLKKL